MRQPIDPAAANRAQPPAPSSLRIALRSLIFAVLTVVAAIGVWFGSAFIALPYLLTALVLTGLVLGIPITALWWLVTRRSAGFRWCSALCRTGLFFALSLAALFGAPVIYASAVTTWYPPAQPRITLSDGKRTVVFQGMVHVASREFYEAVVVDMEKARREGYQFLLEGVQSTTREGNRAFNDALGADALGIDFMELFQLLADTCNFTFQPQVLGLFDADIESHPEQFTPADVTTEELLAEKKRLLDAHPELAGGAGTLIPAEYLTAENIEQAKAQIAWVRSFTPYQKAMAGPFCRLLLRSMQLSSADISTAEQQGFALLGSVIGDYRDRHLAETVLNSSAEKLYLPWGVDHFKGFYRMLREKNPAWHIVDIRWKRSLFESTVVEGDPAALVG